MEFAIFNYYDDKNINKKIVYKYNESEDIIYAKKHFETYHPDVSANVMTTNKLNGHYEEAPKIDIEKCYRLIGMEFTENCTGTNRTKNVRKRLFKERGLIAFDNLDGKTEDLLKVYTTKEEALNCIAIDSEDTSPYGQQYHSTIEKEKYNVGWGIAGTVYAVAEGTTNDIIDIADFSDDLIDVYQSLLGKSLSNEKNLYYYKVNEKETVFSVDEEGNVRYTSDLKFPEIKNSVEAALFLMNIESDSWWKNDIPYKDFKTDYIDKYNYLSNEEIGSNVCFNIDEINIDNDVDL